MTTPQQINADEARGEGLSAIQSACEEIRWQRTNELLKSISRKLNRRVFGNNAQFESVIMDACKPALEKPVNNLHLNGGGLDGLIDDAVKLALNESGGNVGKAAEKLKINRSTFYEYRKRLTLVALCLCVSVVNGFAQRGTNIKQPAATVGTLALPVPVFRQTVLRWDNPPGASNVVSWGLARNAWTNGNRTITTNSFFVTNNWHYRVTAMVAGVESTPALWPSNRLGGDIWLMGYSTNLTQPTNITKLLSYKGNNPPGNMRFWGVIDLTTGWE